MFLLHSSSRYIAGSLGLAPTPRSPGVGITPGRC